MNMLIDLLPSKVEIEGNDYAINTDFRYGILFELLMQDDDLLDDEKMYNAINLYYPSIPNNLPLAVEKMLWFYKCGKESEIKESSNSGKEGPTGEIYSFEYDDDYIYAAFLEQYGIDLQDDNLHWWKFRALFKSLNENVMISKIMSYRSMRIDNNMSDSEKSYYRKMKEIYKLPDGRTREEKEVDFNSSMSKMF